MQFPVYCSTERYSKYQSLPKYCGIFLLDTAITSLLHNTSALQKVIRKTFNPHPPITLNDFPQQRNKKNSNQLKAVQIKHFYGSILKVTERVKLLHYRGNIKWKDKEQCIYSGEWWWVMGYGEGGGPRSASFIGPVMNNWVQRVERFSFWLSIKTCQQKSIFGGHRPVISFSWPWFVGSALHVSAWNWGTCIDLFRGEGGLICRRPEQETWKVWYSSWNSHPGTILPSRG